jgi:hypothetical protein
MTVIHCGFKDCANNEDEMCHAAAIRLDKNECCLTYQALENGGRDSTLEKGDRLTWDQEYIDEDPIDDESGF